MPKKLEPLHVNFEAADITTNLQSTGKTCDAGTEVLFTKKGCVVVPEGHFSKHFDPGETIQFFGRVGSTYANKVRLSALKGDSSFPGQGNA